MKVNIKSNTIKFLALSVLTSVLLTNGVLAQFDVLSESQKIQQAYKNPAYLRFDLEYTYAFETDPTVILDSSLGNFKMSGSRYWGIIDDAEFMQNDSFSIVVYKPGKLIHVSRPRNVYPQIAGFASLDSFVGKEGYTYSFSSSKGNRVLNLSFTDPLSPYKLFRVSYDSVSYRVNEMSFIIKEEYLSDEALTDYAGNGSGKYLRVKASYKNYSTEMFSPGVFDAANYFLVSKGAYNAVSQYTGYEVFLSSPDLSSNQQPLH